MLLNLIAKFGSNYCIVIKLLKIIVLIECLKHVKRSINVHLTSMVQYTVTILFILPSNLQIGLTFEF